MKKKLLFWVLCSVSLLLTLLILSGFRLPASRTLSPTLAIHTMQPASTLVGTWKGTERFVSGKNKGQENAVTFELLSDQTLQEHTVGQTGSFSGTGFWSLTDGVLTVQFTESLPQALFVVVAEHTTKLSDHAMTLSGLGGLYTSALSTIPQSQGTSVSEIWKA